MGLFSDLAVFQAPEAVLERQLQTNPFHPFRLASDDAQYQEKIFLYSFRQHWFYIYLLIAFTSFLFTIVWPSTGNDREYVVFAVAVFILSVYLCLDSWPRWSIVLEPASHHYSVYHGARLVASQHCHNIYIRLVPERTSSRSPRYQLVVDGWGLETTLHLTRYSPNRKKLRQLAHELANSLQINYFDVHNTSRHHIIRHNRPFTNSTGPSGPDAQEE